MTASNISRLAFLTMAFFATSAVPASSFAQGGVNPPPQIVVSSTGEATVVPDRALITFAVETRASTAAAAGAENARLQAAIIAALRAKGAQSEYISTSGYSVGPNERYDNGQRRVIGYIARNGVVVDVQRIDQVGPFIDAALGAGANSIGGLRYYSSRSDAVRRTAIENAVAKAKNDADVMARAAGGSLGSAIELSVSDAGSPRPMFDMADARMAMASAQSGAPETPVIAGELKIMVQVTTRWLFIAGR